MEKRYLCIISFFLMFLLSGCGQKTSEVDLLNLQSETGDYQYGALDWGSSRTDVESVLGVTLSTADHEVNHIKSYIVKDAYSLNGLPAIVTCEFDATDTCCAIQFQFTPETEDAQAFWDNLIATLTSRYGDVDPTHQESMIPQTQTLMQTETYLWDHSDTIRTALCARKTNRSGGSPIIELIVYPVPDDRS